MKLESRPLYAIGTIARLTGLKPDTLRVWERRYGLGASHRSQTGRRQYTQADLEHMQLVATLVNSGVRIGEIAACGRKTLEIMVRRSHGATIDQNQKKPGVLVVGTALCQWLDEHQGCLSHVHASLARLSLAEAERALADVPVPDLLVLGCDNLAVAQVRQVQALAAALGAERTLVAYGRSNERSLEMLRQQGISSTMFPPDPGFLAFELTRLAAELETRQGSVNLGDLVSARPRQISREELAAASSALRGASGIQPARLAALVSELSALEDDIAAAAVEEWSDAAVAACAYAYAGQARWLLEKALQLALTPQEERGQQLAVDDEAGRLHDAA